MRRKFSHWTPTYVRDRLMVMLDERIRPENPWLTRDSVRFLDQVLQSADVGLEFGSGRSSVWFAQRMKHLTSVEDNREWHVKVSGLIADRQLTGRLSYLFRENRDDYLAEANACADESLDFCLVDGSYRDECAIRVVSKIKRGGLLVIDNVNWYLPSGSMAPASIGPSGGYPSAAWTAFAAAVQGWRRYWTSNGVSDTCIWFKPC
jgi:predicted O-methyltransferase YrrM